MSKAMRAVIETVIDGPAYLLGYVMGEAFVLVALGVAFYIGMKIYEWMTTWTRPVIAWFGCMVGGIYCALVLYRSAHFMAIIFLRRAAE